MKLLLSLMVLCLASTNVMASWPERNVTVVLPFPAGNGSDMIGRILADELSKKFNVNFVVENKPGATTTLGTNHVINSTPDGYTILFTSVSTIAAKFVLRNTKHDIEKDLFPITSITESPMALIVSPKKFKTIQEFIKAGKERELLFGSVGYGSSTHFVGAKFMDFAKLKYRTIPYKGTQQIYNDLVTGEIDFTFTPIQGAKSLYDGGQLNFLGIVSDKRLSVISSIPTFKELGYKNFDFYFWTGVYVPKDVSLEIANKILIALNQIKNSDSFKNKLGNLGIIPTDDLTFKQFIKFIRKQQNEYSKMVKDLSIEIK